MGDLSRMFTGCGGKIQNARRSLPPQPELRKRRERDLPEPWTGDLIGKMHNHGITYNDLGAKLGITNQYISLILNGFRNPSGIREKMENAVDELIHEKNRK